MAVAKNKKAAAAKGESVSPLGYVYGSSMFNAFGDHSSTLGYRTFCGQKAVCVKSLTTLALSKADSYIDNTTYFWSRFHGDDFLCDCCICTVAGQ